jgi:alkylation response protein AidB-like acyl-CoA dehydrogenase
MTTGVSVAAERLADEVLFPAALATDRSDVVPVELLDALAASGLYGLSGPASAGGLEADFPTVCAVIEALASGCLTTTFVWVQHLGGVIEAAKSERARSRVGRAPVPRRAACRARARRCGARPAAAGRASDGRRLDAQRQFSVRLRLGPGRCDLYRGPHR